MCRHLIRLLAALVVGTLLVSACAEDGSLDLAQLENFLGELTGVAWGDSDDTGIKAADKTDKATRDWNQALKDSKDALRDLDLDKITEILDEWPAPGFYEIKLAILLATGRQYGPDGKPTPEYAAAAAGLTDAVRTGIYGDKDMPDTPEAKAHVDRVVWMDRLTAYKFAVWHHPPGTPDGKRMAEKYCQSLSDYRAHGWDPPNGHYPGHDITNGKPQGTTVCQEYL